MSENGQKQLNTTHRADDDMRINCALKGIFWLTVGNLLYDPSLSVGAGPPLNMFVLRIVIHPIWRARVEMAKLNQMSSEQSY